MRIVLRILITALLIPVCLAAMFVLSFVAAFILAVIVADSWTGGEYAIENLVPDKQDYVDPEHVV